MWNGPWISGFDPGAIAVGRGDGVRVRGAILKWILSRKPPERLAARMGSVFKPKSRVQAYVTRPLEKVMDLDLKGAAAYEAGDWYFANTISTEKTVKSADRTEWTDFNAVFSRRLPGKHPLAVLEHAPSKEFYGAEERAPYMRLIENGTLTHREPPIDNHTLYLERGAEDPRLDDPSTRLLLASYSDVFVVDGMLLYVFKGIMPDDQVLTAIVKDSEKLAEVLNAR